MPLVIYGPQGWIHNILTRIHIRMKGFKKTRLKNGYKYIRITAV